MEAQFIYQQKIFRLKFCVFDVFGGRVLISEQFSNLKLPAFLCFNPQIFAINRYSDRSLKILDIVSLRIKSY